MHSILDWLALLAFLQLLQVVGTGFTLYMLHQLFTQHDGSVLEKLDELIAVARNL